MANLDTSVVDLDSSYVKTEDDCSSSEVDEKKPFVRKAKFKCTFAGCNEEFRRQVGLDRHLFKHTGIKQHSCPFPECGKSYSNSSHLKRHIKSSHEIIDPIRVECQEPTCTVIFANTSAMQKHFKLYHGPNGSKIHGCSECTERFAKKAQLKVHMYKHTGNYPQKCQECDAGFLNIKQLHSHIRITHRKTGKHCARCKLDFPNWSSLIFHNKGAHKKNYSCPLCPHKVYPGKARLKAHIKEAHKEGDKEPKIFKCPFDECEYTHAHQCHVRQHVYKRHRGIKIKCTLCNVMLSSELILKRHLARMHPNGTAGIRPQKHRRDAGKPRASASTQLSGIKADPEVEQILLAGEGRRLQIQYTPTTCGWDNTSATDTESEATSIVHNTYAF